MDLEPNRPQIECTLCGRMFTKKSSLNMHQRSHTGEKPFQCSFCGEKFTRKSSQKKHESRKHSGMNPEHSGLNPEFNYYRDNSFIKRTTIIPQICIKEEKLWPCHLCAKLLSDKSSLNSHLHSVHGGNKPFECAQCGQRFTKKSSLNMHRLIHTGEKPFECLQCGEKFTRKSSLKSHCQRKHVQTCSNQSNFHITYRVS